MSRSIDLAPVLSGPVTPTSSAVVDLVRTMEKIAEWYREIEARDRDATDEEMRLCDKLEERKSALEEQIKREVKAALGVEWDILYEALS